MIPLRECSDVAELSYPSYRALLRDIGHVELALADRWEAIRLDLISERNANGN